MAQPMRCGPLGESSSVLRKRVNAVYRSTNKLKEFMSFMRSVYVGSRSVEKLHLSSLNNNRIKILNDHGCGFHSIPEL